MPRYDASGVPAAAWNGWYEWDPADDPPRKTRRRAAPRSSRAVPGRPGAEGAARSSAAGARSGGGGAAARSAEQGEWGERKAEEWLVANAGLKTLGRRVKVGRDELDLVMLAPATDTRPQEVVFVEVKTRSSESFGGGMGAIDRRKRHALGRAASRWMMRNADCPMRIDVVEVYGDCATGRVDEIRHQVAAVPLERRLNTFALGRSGAGGKPR